MKLDGSSRFILGTAAALAQAYNVTIAFKHPYSALRLRQLGAYFRLNVDELKLSTLDSALGDANAWEAAFVFGSSPYPTIPAPCKCNFYLSEHPLVTKSQRRQHQALSAGYVYVCYGKSTLSTGKGVQGLPPPAKQLKTSKRASHGTGFTADCRTHQYRKNYLILARALTAPHCQKFGF
jgi:hypothetical protein